MTRTVHVLPANRLETECVVEALKREDIDARAGGPSADAENACAGVVVLALDGVAVDGLIREVKSRLVDRPVLVVADAEKLTVLQAVDGSRDRLARLTDSTSSLTATVREMLDGRGAERASAATTPNMVTFDTLTRRELEIAAMLAGGWRNEEIADELGISAHTVRTHVQRVLGKLDVHHRLGLAAKLPQQGTSSRPRRTVAHLRTVTQIP